MAAGYSSPGPCAFLILGGGTLRHWVRLHGPRKIRQTGLINPSGSILPLDLALFNVPDHPGGDHVMKRTQRFRDPNRARLFVEQCP